MAMKTAADGLKTALEEITSPATPTVRKVPQGHGDDRPRAASHTGSTLRFWINIEPTGQERSDEPNRSQLRGYGFTVHAWWSDISRDMEDAADNIMDMVDEVFDKLQHNTLAGWARHGLSVAEMENGFESGEDGDTAYVVRYDVVVWKQEA